MEIRKEADRLLNDYGLLKLLEKHGEAHLIGSYRMDIMTWNDLDIYIENENPSPDFLFSLSCEVNFALKPYRFDGSCNTERKMLLCGCETLITGERWNIDISLRTKNEIEKTKDYCDYIVQRILADPLRGTAIKNIKYELIKRRLYGIDKFPEKHYHSKDIYDAVLNGNIITFDDFIAKYPCRQRCDKNQTAHQG